MNRNEKPHSEKPEEKRRLALQQLLQQFHDTNSYDEALGLFKQLMTLETDLEKKAAYGLRMGGLAEGEHNFEAAREFYREALALQPTRHEVWYYTHNNLGYSLNMLGQFREGEKLCREAVKIDPNLSNGHKNLGISLAGQGEYRAAGESFVHATRANPRDPRSLALLKTLLQEQPALEFEFASRLAECVELVNSVGPT